MDLRSRRFLFAVGDQMRAEAFHHLHFPAFVEFFITSTVPETHSTKHIEDGIAYAHDSTPDALQTGMTGGFGFGGKSPGYGGLGVDEAKLLVAT